MPDEIRPMTLLDISHISRAIGIAKFLGMQFPIGGPLPIQQILTLEKAIEENADLALAGELAVELDKLPQYQQELAQVISFIESVAGKSGTFFHYQHYSAPTRRVWEKQRMWKNDKFAQEMKHNHGVDIDILKSILFRYSSENGPKYIIANTLAGHRVDQGELRVELGLNRMEAESLAPAATHEELIFKAFALEGCVRPIVPWSKLDGLVGIYFTRDLLSDATKNPHKVYDIAMTLDSSIFVNAFSLWGTLRQIHRVYRGPSDLEAGELPLSIESWKNRQCDLQSAGVPSDFSGTVVTFRGQPYVIWNPRKKGLTLARPGPLERNGERMQRVMLPFGYNTLFKMYHNG